MNKRVLILLSALCVAGLAWAAAEQTVDRYGGQFPLHLNKGLYVGPEGSQNPVKDTLNRISAIRTCAPTVNIGAAAAAATVVATGSCPGLALGDVVLPPAPAADDVAWDEGPLTAFAESANTVKLVYHADATGGDPANMIYYITFIKRQ